MTQNKLKVLMLGWEFPPIISGGLGVACYGLSKALARLVDLTIIVPKADPNFIVEGVRVIGLNHIDIQNLSLPEMGSEGLSQEDLQYLQETIYPYQSSDAQVLTARARKKRKSDPINNQQFLFDVDDLYAGDVGARVTYYGKVVAALAAQMDFDVVHAHDWMTYSAGIEIKNHYKKPLVVHVHSTEVDRNGTESKGWVYHLEKRACDVADVIVPVSHYTGSILQKYYETAAEKLAPVHNGVDQVRSYRSESNLPEKVVLFLGRITGQKGPEYFFQTASKVLDILPNTRFVMAGTGNLVKGLIEMGAYKHLGNRFHFTGFLNQEKVRYLYSIADVYVMPSVSEPFGLSALEAAQFGIPCVISKQSGVAEVLQGALKADYWDTDKMASNIVSVLKYKGLRDQLVKDAYHDLSKLTWSNAAHHLIEVYRTRLNL